MNTRKLNMNPSAALAAASNKKSFVKYGGIATVIAAALAGAAQYLHHTSDDIPQNPEDVEGEDSTTEADTNDVTSEHVDDATASTQSGTSTSTQQSTTTTTTTGEKTVEDDDKDVTDPQDVAHKIIAELEIDDDDVYDVALIRFDQFTTVFTEDGEELNAVIFHLLGETEPYVLVDMNGDGTYTHIFDSNLDYVDIPVPYPFNEDDIRYAMESEIGYIGPQTILTDDDDDLAEVDFNEMEESEVAAVDDIDYDDEDVRELIESFFDMPFDEFAETYWDTEDDVADEPGTGLDEIQEEPCNVDEVIDDEPSEEQFEDDEEESAIDEDY